MDGMSRRLAAAAIVAGLCWRLGAAWAPGDAAQTYAQPQEGYFLSSVVLLSRGVYSSDPGGAPQTGRGPLFTSFLALSQAGASRPSPRRARVAQALLGALAALAAWGLGARLRSPLAGALAAALVSFDPRLVVAVRGLDVHGFYGVVILLLGCAAAHWAESRGDRRSSILLGLALGASFLTRSAHLAVLVLLPAAAWIWWKRHAGVVLLVAAAVLLPWTARNYAHTGRFVPLDAGTGAYNLLAAADGGDLALRYEEAFAVADKHRPGFSAAHRDEPVERRDSAVMKLALALIAERPADYALGVLRRLRAFFLPLAVFLLPALWAALAPGASRGTRAAALVAASFLAYGAVGLGEGYRLGLEPLLAALAGVGLAALFDARAKPSASALRAAFPAAGLIAVAAVLCLLLVPRDALAARRAGRADCEPPPAFLAAFLDDGVRLAGKDWYLAQWPGALRARPEVCAGMKAFAAGDAAEAATRFAAAAAAAPMDASIRVSLAVALGASGRKAQALRECAAAESLADASAPSYEQKRLRDSIRSTRAGLEHR